jgi:SAM-dependent methyltransferase
LSWLTVRSFMTTSQPSSTARPLRLNRRCRYRRRFVHETPYRREPGYAQRYRDRRFATAHGPGTDRRERAALRRLLRAVPVGDGGLWLDVPSGAGRLTEELPGPALQVDRDLAMLRACPGQRPRVCASAVALPFRDGAFAGALCHRLLQHIPTPAERIAILTELARVTRGPVVVSFFDAHSLQHGRRVLRRATGKPRSGRGAITRAELCRELQQAGLRAVAFAPLWRFVAEQTLVLCAHVQPPRP